VVAAILTFDRLVHIQRARHPRAWEADGRPGTLWRDRDQFDHSVRTWIATQRCSVSWLFVTRPWMLDDPECRVLHRRHRILAVVWTFVALPLFLASAILTAR